MGKTVFLLNMRLTEILWQSQIANPCVPRCVALYGNESETCTGWEMQRLGLMLPFRAVVGAGGLEHFQEKGTDTKVSSHIAANTGKESAWGKDKTL